MLSNHTSADYDPLPEIVPPIRRECHLARNLPWRTAFNWLGKGWTDMWTNPLPSLVYGFVVFAISVLIVWLMFRFELDYALFPALSGFLVVGPLLALGLYEKSRRLELGEQITFAEMILIRPRSGASALMMGVMLLGLFLLWMRAAVLIWALFFGIQPFPGSDEIIETLFVTPTGWGLLLVGGAVGALFAAFAFAISVFSVPMLLREQTDALTALGLSIAAVWNNLAVMLVWGAVVFFLTVLSLSTLFIGLIVIVPLLGHSTWHAFRAIDPSEGKTPEIAAAFE